MSALAPFLVGTTCDLSTGLRVARMLCVCLCIVMSVRLLARSLAFSLALSVWQTAYVKDGDAASPPLSASFSVGERLPLHCAAHHKSSLSLNRSIASRKEQRPHERKQCRKE